MMTTCKNCPIPVLCAEYGRNCEIPKAAKDLAKQAVESQRNDKRTIVEKIQDGVSFICDTRIGGS